ncbi:MAG TPA: ornithine carbamoyltransferase [Firmicutes bacterium]|nr:MAG: ornithine carbamoyltransferase [Candidatus Coatesbacteria bacterium]HEC79912.1 ornithine carbamoyltransferase [Bacillota bacterium]
MVKDIKGLDFISLADFNREELLQLIELAIRLKQERYTGIYKNDLEGYTLGMIFEKPSLRTRVSFEVAMNDLGGRAIYLSPSDIQLGKRETIEDAAIVLSSMVHVIMARTFSHETIEELAEYSAVPVINGLSDLLHPCQGLADFMTIYEKFNRLDGLKLAFVGDGNNVCHSLLLGGSILGLSISVATPEGYEPNDDVLTYAKELAVDKGQEIKTVNNPYEAVEGSDVVYTDVWASMGQEKEVEKRKKDFEGFQIDMDMFSKASDNAILLHCLPAHYGEEMTYEVSRHERSAIFDQAENRLHTAKAVLLSVI